MLGEVDAGLLWHVGYFVVLGSHRGHRGRTPARTAAAVLTAGRAQSQPLRRARAYASVRLRVPVLPIAADR